jgi:hypothetical protein
MLLQDDNWRKEGFSYTQYLFFRKCSQRGKKQAEICRQKAINVPKAVVSQVYAYTGEMKRDWDSFKQRAEKVKQLSFLNK